MSQELRLSDVLQKVGVEPDEEKQVDIMLDAIREIVSFGSGNSVEALELLEKAETLAQKLSYPLGLARSTQLTGQLAFFRMDYDTAFSKTNEAIIAFEALGDTYHLAETLMGLAMATWDSGDYSKGLDLAFKALKCCEDVGYEETAGIVSYMIGSFYLDLKEYKNAQKYFQQGYLYSTAAKTRPQSIARCIIGLGSVALVNSNYTEAIHYFKEAEAIQLEVGDKSGLARSYNDLGKVYFQLKKYEEADAFFHKSIAIRETLGNLTGLITTCMDIAEMYLSQNRLEEAKPMLDRALELSDTLSTKGKRYRTYRLLGEWHKKKGEWEQALYYFDEFYTLKEEVQGEGFSFEIRKLEKRIALEKKEQEAEIYRLRNVELKGAYERIEKKNKDITASINYAKRIQDAMLYDMAGLKAFVKDYFVLFKPRDIVSGDFYWYTAKDGKAFVAAVDCTGHGVPGAFMSLIGNSLLDQAVHLKNLKRPSDILAYLHEEVHRLLHQSEGENNDGMDMGLCIIDRQKEEICFAGAKNPLLYIQEGELHVIKGDKMPIGGSNHYRKNTVFTDHCMPIVPNNIYYLLSDGYQDQFGGGKAEKFKLRRLKELLLSKQHLPLQAQKEALSSTLDEWIGEEKQIDDILVLGFTF